MSAYYEHIEIYWLEATVAFGTDKIPGVWPVSVESDGSYNVTVDRVNEGKQTEWIIPFGISETDPSPSRKSGHRVLRRELDMKDAKGYVQEG